MVVDLSWFRVGSACVKTIDEDILFVAVEGSPLAPDSPETSRSGLRVMSKV